jgi:hypothetical protein
MSISEQGKFIFIKINRCAGSSMQTGIEEHFDDLQEKGHRSIRAFDVDYDKYFKFCFVRNPWDKMVSFYHFHKRRRFDRLPDNSRPDFKTFICKSMHDMTFPMPNGQSTAGMRMSNQTEWLRDAAGEIRMDFIGRFENLHADYATVCGKLNIPVTELPHKSKSRHDHYTSYYDDETAAIVASRFSDDLKILGYEYGA